MPEIDLDSTSGTTQPKEGGYSCRALEGQLMKKRL